MSDTPDYDKIATRVFRAPPFARAAGRRRKPAQPPTEVAPIHAAPDTAELVSGLGNIAADAPDYDAIAARISRAPILGRRR